MLSQELKRLQNAKTIKNSQWREQAVESTEAEIALAQSNGQTDGRMDGGSARESTRGAMMQTFNNRLKAKVLVIVAHKQTQVVWLAGWLAS